MSGHKVVDAAHVFRRSSGSRMGVPGQGDLKADQGNMCRVYPRATAILRKLLHDRTATNLKPSQNRNGTLHVKDYNYRVNRYKT